MQLQEFTSKFRFRRELTRHIGVERECFITNGNGAIVPYAEKLLNVLKGTHPQIILEKPLDSEDRFTYELSACQIEGRTRPCASVDEIADDLHGLDTTLKTGMQLIDCKPLYREVAPTDIPLAVYPDPNGRYQDIVSGMSEETLRSACSIIGTHVLIGMPDHHTALKVYNEVVDYTEELCELGDNSGGERLAIYNRMNPGCRPRKFSSWYDVYEYYQKRGQLQDPRRCWNWIRFSVHGALEFRMFGATEDVNDVVHWAKTSQGLCEAFMH